MTYERAERWVRRGRDLQGSTLIELFFDLVFVFALSQTTRTVAAHLTPSGFLPVLLLLAVWWIWSVTTWATDLYTQRAGLNLLIVVVMFGVLVMASSLPEAFEDRGLAFATSYVGAHLVRTSTLLYAVRKHPIRRRPIRVLFWIIMSSPLWLAGAFLPGTARITLWAAALVIDYTVANIGWPVPGLGRSSVSEWNLVAGHLAERYHQIVIIALGETILTMGSDYALGRPLPVRTIGLATAFLITALLWQIYSMGAGLRITRAFAAGPHPGRSARRLDWSHLLMVGGIVLTGVGDDVVIGYPSGHTPLVWAGVIVLGPALFLAGRGHLGYVVAGVLDRALPLGILALVALAPAALVAPPLAIAFGTMLILLAIVLSHLRTIERDAIEQTNEVPS